MINSSSRYANAIVTLLDSTRGQVVTMVPSPPRPKIINYTYVRTDAADRLDAMAAYLYGDETLWWVIADANPEILDWTDLPVGTVLRIPDAY